MEWRKKVSYRYTGSPSITAAALGLSTMPAYCFSYAVTDLQYAKTQTLCFALCTMQCCRHSVENIIFYIRNAVCFANCKHLTLLLFSQPTFFYDIIQKI